MIARNTGRLARPAFTLIELMIVISIIVMLAGIGGYYYMKHLDEAKRSTALLQSKTVTQAVEAYYIKHGEYPASLVVLTEKDSDGTKPYLEADALKTPWDNVYQYDPSGPNNGGNKPDVWADSPQGKVGNWMKQ